jgi:hypothetical protein
VGQARKHGAQAVKQSQQGQDLCLGGEVEHQYALQRCRGLARLLATMASDKTELTDSSYAVGAVEDLIALFGKAPRGYAYDRGGYSTQNVERLGKLGVRNIGLAPRGRAPWEVQGKVRDRLIRERALVEGSIGTIKCSKYGFNRPAARSAAMMGLCGQRAVLGLNLTKLHRGAAEKRGIALAA